MWWPFKKEESSIDPKKELEGLLKAQELLNQRFEKKYTSNEEYLKTSEDLRKKIEKCKKRIEKLNN